MPLYRKGITIRVKKYGDFNWIGWDGWLRKTTNLPFTWDFGRIPGWKKRRWATMWKSNYSAGLLVHHSRVDWTWQTMRWIWWWFSWMDVLFGMARATGISSPFIKLHRPQHWESFFSRPINRPSLQTRPQPPSCPGVSTGMGLMGQKSPTGVTIHRWNWDVIRDGTIDPCI